MSNEINVEEILSPEEQVTEAAEKDVKQQVEELLASANLTKKELEDVKVAVIAYIEAKAREEYAEHLAKLKDFFAKIEARIGRPALYAIAVFLLLKHFGVI